MEMDHHSHQSHYNPRVNDFVSTVFIYVHIPVNYCLFKKNTKELLLHLIHVFMPKACLVSAVTAIPPQQVSTLNSLSPSWRTCATAEPCLQRVNI